MGLSNKALAKYLYERKSLDSIENSKDVMVTLFWFIMQ